MAYPRGLKIHIDGVEFASTGLCVEERITGTYSSRRWIAVAPTHENGIRHSPRLVAEEGIKGLRERADRQRLHAQRQGHD